MPLRYTKTIFDIKAKEIANDNAKAFFKYQKLMGISSELTELKNLINDFYGEEVIKNTYEDFLIDYRINDGGE
jgi:hypothetical protein